MPLAATPAAPGGSAESPTATLTRRMEAGDEAAWHDFHAAYAPRLQRYLLVICHGDEQLAAEVRQQTFLRAVRYLRICDSEPELWNWLALLARSAALDARRRERRYLGFLDRWFQHHSDPVLPSVDTEKTLETALEVELAALPAAERELLEQKYLAGTSVRELASNLNTSEKAVESRLTRARQKLKHALLQHLQNENRA